jgi:hypothetical protein
MIEPSSEQQNIIDHIKNGKNVIVDACAGSGKSTTILSCAQQMPNKRFLQITYNSMLRMEIKEKVKQYRLKNITVHTYHSLAVAKYTKEACTDTGIRRILRENMVPISQILPQDVIVLDETQDMTFLYYQLVIKIARDMGTPFQLLILGDYMQGLYEFKGADIRFLTLADRIWANFSQLTTQNFEKCSLKMSYRITNQMAAFVNEVMLGEQRLYACKDGDPVIYIRNTKHILQRIVTYHILELIKKGAKPGDFFVLGASVKGPNSQIRRIENSLVEAGIPCHVPMLETDKIDEKVIDGKVVFSTFHSVKGRQRPYVFIVGFDQSYLTHFSKNLDHTICPNTLYVASTRATKQLFILEKGEENPTDRPLTFLHLTHNDMKQKPYIQFKGQARTIFYDPPENEVEELKTHHVTPTDLIKFLPESVLEEVSPLLDKIFIRETNESEEELIDIPVMIQTKSGFYEDISDLNGIAIPSIYYDYLKEKWASETEENTDNSGETQTEEPNILYGLIQDTLTNTKSHEYLFLKNLLETINPNIETIEDYLLMANIFVASQEKLYYKLRQIERDEYNWLPPEILSKCKKRLLNILENKYALGDSRPVIEENIINYIDEEAHIAIDQILDQYFPEEKFRFTARIDLGTERTIWELKCTTTISQDHLLQTVIYAWIWRTVYPDSEQEFRIFNIKTGVILLLDSSKEILDIIVLEILKGKYERYSQKEDSDFLSSCIQTFSSII